MLITIELENAIDHLFRGEELLPSAEGSNSTSQNRVSNVFLTSKPFLLILCFLQNR